MEDHVSLWLHQCGLGEYASVFKAAGYDDINLIKLLNDSDLDAMGIDKPGTRKKILVYADQLKLIPESHSLHSLETIPIPQMQSPRPKGNNRANPYRCTKCCEFKIRSLDGKAHQCNPDLIGHSWENCPTKNIRQHPEEKQRRKTDDRHKGSRSRKRKGVQDDPLTSGWEGFGSGEELSDDHFAHYQAFPDDPQQLAILSTFAFAPHDECDPRIKRQKGDLEGHVLDNLAIAELEAQLAAGAHEHDIDEHEHLSDEQSETLASHLHY